MERLENGDGGIREGDMGERGFEGIVFVKPNQRNI
jgi:hypothetical protein